MIRLIYLVFGICALILAAIGVILPILPTVPLVLLAGFCFARSSNRMHSLLLKNKYFGPMLKQWEETKSITPKAKYSSIAVLALSIGISTLFIVEETLTKVILVAVAVGVILYIMRLPVIKPQESVYKEKDRKR